MHSSPVCYLLTAGEGRSTYVGATVHLSRRLRQHNGELCGGARATRNHRPWRVHTYVRGFSSWRAALSFEWHWKRKARGAKARARRARELAAGRFREERLAVVVAMGTGEEML
jgi:structure-specific endonuclease subunit SLX1